MINQYLSIMVTYDILKSPSLSLLITIYQKTHLFIGIGQKGEPGDRGLQGFKGAFGPRGEKGIAGMKGERGERGYSTKGNTSFLIYYIFPYG